MDIITILEYGLPFMVGALIFAVPVAVFMEYKNNWFTVNPNYRSRRVKGTKIIYKYKWVK